MHTFRSFFGLRKNIVAVLTMAVLLGMGERMGERFLPLYLLALGGGALSIGLLNGMDNLLSALYAFPGGYLSDRLGHKRSLLLFNLLAMAGFALVAAIPAWQAVIVGAVFFLSWSAISLPATMSLVAEALPREKRTMGVSMHSLVRRIPMALGPLVGGYMISVYGRTAGVRLAFLIALVFALASLIFQQVMIKEAPGEAHLAEARPWRVYRLMSPDLRNLLVSDILVRFCEQIPYAFAVVWAVDVIGISAFQFGLLTVVEMATAVLIYIPVAYLADRTAKKPFVLITFGFFTLFPLMLWRARSFEWLLLAFIVRGLKEFGEPTRKALIMDHAPEGRKAGVFGLYYLIRDVIVSFAAFGGALLWQISPSTNFAVALGFGLLGTLYFGVFGRNVPFAKAESPRPASSA